jgi:hypothetical protein
VPRPSYFLIAVSNRENLKLCIKYGLAGFPSSAGGAWTFCEIQEGDFISFLYGARAHNLYQAVQRDAVRNAEDLPPWKNLTSKISGRTFFFPFRVQLKPIRTFNEPVVRAEFSYVAENLLLRGGYRKTHFQADQTTLQNVSQMGTLAHGSVEQLSLPDCVSFNPSFTRNQKLFRSPEVCRFDERVLQTAIRRHLLDEANLAGFLRRLNLTTLQGDSMEVLGEKALPQGYIDLLLKERVPLGAAPKIPIEVKLGTAQPKDVLQLRDYMDELMGECLCGVLIAAEFGRKTVPLARESSIRLVRYALRENLGQTASFDNIWKDLSLNVFEE